MTGLFVNENERISPTLLMPLLTVCHAAGGEDVNAFTEGTAAASSLGGNDALRGLPVAQAEQALRAQKAAEPTGNDAPKATSVVPRSQ